jgi:hypothetical protein
MSRPGSTSCADGVAALDRLAPRLLAGAEPVRVAVASDDEDLRALQRLRYRQVREWIAAPEPDGDTHDDDALHIAAWDGAALAGGMRLVLPAPGRLLPVEEAFGLEVEPRGAVAEAGRLVIAPEHRGDPAHRIWGALFARAWLELRARGLSVLAGSASPRMVERLTALGLPFVILGPAREHWGELRHPVRLDPACGDPRWYA